ncbi:unnamed protein product [Lactuca saligna]|uniref:Uncharacterized protein n=1 Tax=Lactuca saligna TaxID=75948 RepID=A0AA35ZV65_LACSI|nr:unnamed protein product [Lactuca saligna]
MNDIARGKNTKASQVVRFVERFRGGGHLWGRQRGFRSDDYPLVRASCSRQKSSKEVASPAFGWTEERTRNRAAKSYFFYSSREARRGGDQKRCLGGSRHQQRLRKKNGNWKEQRLQQARDLQQKGEVFGFFLIHTSKDTILSYWTVVFVFECGVECCIGLKKLYKESVQL